MRIALETKISAGGTNFSNGQRQLIAMARVALPELGYRPGRGHFKYRLCHRCQDPGYYQRRVQRLAFADRSSSTPHRCVAFLSNLDISSNYPSNLVIDYDRLIVLDKGQIAEFDTPYNLIRKMDGTFRSMCSKSGMLSELEAAAKAKAESA